MITKGVDEIKKHKICVAEGQDISRTVSGAPIEFKRTIGLLGANLKLKASESN